jgi:CRP-like cAMP-binding protein
MKDIKQLIQEHPFFKGMETDDLSVLAGCGRNEFYRADTYLAQEGTLANDFYIIRQGVIQVEVHAPPKAGQIIQTLKGGDIAGWSWIFPPYRWNFDLKVAEDCSVITMDGLCLRDKCEADPRLGYDLMKRFAAIMTERLRATRMQLLDLYEANHDVQSD